MKQLGNIHMNTGFAFHLKYPHNLDQSLNDAADKIRKYLTDFRRRPPRAVSFIPTIVSTSGRLHSEFVRLLFLETHRETDRFFTTSGIHLPDPNSGLFHFRRSVFSPQVKTKVGNTGPSPRLNLYVST
jgi:hypothetical protein